jgi:type VI secretion system secreted protein Hcp
MAVDMFLKLIDIKGEATATGHLGEIEILSWSWGETNSLGSGGERVVQDFHFTKMLDKSSPQLMLACSMGNALKSDQNGNSAYLYVRKAGGDKQIEFIVVTFTDVLVSSYLNGGHAGGAVPTDQFSLNFAKFRFAYRTVNRDGSVDVYQKVDIFQQLPGV